MSYTPSRTLAYCCLASSMALVGVYVALSKPLVAALPVFLLGWLRFGIGGLAMPHWFRSATPQPLSRSTKRLLFLESFFGNFLFTVCMLYGMSLTSAVAAGVIMASIPAAIALLGWILLKERISTQIWLAIACSGLGIAILSLGHDNSRAADYPHAWLGNLLVFGAVLCEAAYAVIGKKLSLVLSPKRITAIINAWGFVLMTPLGLYYALQFDFAKVDIGIWALLLFYSLTASVGTVWLWMTGLKVIPATRAGVFSVLLPVSAATVGVLVLGESLTAAQCLAFVLALAGLVIASRPHS